MGPSKQRVFKPKESQGVQDIKYRQKENVIHVSVHETAFELFSDLNEG